MFCSVRVSPSCEARVLTPIVWDSMADVEPAELTIGTVPVRFAELGDLHARVDDADSPDP